MLAMVTQTVACCLYYEPFYVFRLIHYLRILHLFHNFDFVGFGIVHIIRIVVGRCRRRWCDGRRWDVLYVDGAAANALPVAAAAVARAVAALAAVGFFGREG